MSRTPTRSTFDVGGFVDALKGVMRERQVGVEAMAAEVGIYSDLIARMKSEGRRPSVDAYLGMCRWSGLDPMAFHVDTPQETREPVTSVFGLARGNTGNQR